MSDKPTFRERRMQQGPRRTAVFNLSFISGSFTLACNSKMARMILFAIDDSGEELHELLYHLAANFESNLEYGDEHRARKLAESGDAPDEREHHRQSFREKRREQRPSKDTSRGKFCLTNIDGTYILAFDAEVAELLLDAIDASSEDLATPLFSMAEQLEENLDINEPTATVSESA